MIRHLSTDALGGSFFAPAKAPSAQRTLFPGQPGSTDPGEASFRRVKAVIEVRGGRATWSLNGLPIATVDLSAVTLGGGKIPIGSCHMPVSLKL